MRKLPVVAGLFGVVGLFAVVPVGFALIAGAWTEKTSSVGPRCSAWDTRNERTVRIKSFDWERYCGPARAVVRVDGKLFLIKHGTCHRNGAASGSA